jgi:hypothetical protein
MSSLHSVKSRSDIRLISMDDVKNLEELFTIQDVARWLKVDDKTVRRYEAAGMFENYIVIPRQKRRRVLFTRPCLDLFRAKYAAGLPAPERPKRAYNRRIEKGKRSKKKRRAA